MSKKQAIELISVSFILLFLVGIISAESERYQTIPCNMSLDYLQQAAAAWRTDDPEFDVWPYPPAEGDGHVDVRDIIFLTGWFNAPCYPDGLMRLNELRAWAGVPPVVEDRWLDLGAARHSRYMRVNEALTHTEDPDLPEYSEIGAEAGGASNIFGGAASMAHAVDVFMGSVSHRFGQLHPFLARVGMGLDGTWATLDVLRGVDGGTWDDWPIVYPGPGQVDVPHSGSSGVEEGFTCTDLLTGEPDWPQDPSGFPVTLQFDWFTSPGPNIGELSFTEAGSSVPAVVCVAPGDAYESMIVIYPDAVLEPGKEYCVDFEGSAGGSEYSKFWCFRTR